MKGYLGRYLPLDSIGVSLDPKNPENVSTVYKDGLRVELADEQTEPDRDGSERDIVYGADNTGRNTPT